MPVKVNGYSERGILNALFHEIRYRGEPLDMLRAFLARCTFPFQAPSFEFESARILVEQSFSDFGDADAVLFLDGTVKQCVFVEAKVKTDQLGTWRLDREWRKFTECLQEARSPSNLFVQLYRKQRLTHRMLHPDEVLLPDGVAQRWRLGRNRVVAKAAEILRPYAENSWFVSLVPASSDDVAAFFEEKRTWSSPFLPAWNMDRWGHLTWERVHQMCQEGPALWPDTLATFDHNSGQIYEPNAGRRAARNAPPELQPFGAVDIEPLVQWLSPGQRRILRAIASAEDGLAQSRIMERFPELGNDSSALRALKAAINRAARSGGRQSVLPEGVGIGGERIHRIAASLAPLRAAIVGACGDV